MKPKTPERLLHVLRMLIKDYPEQSLGSHIIMATSDTSLEFLSDKAFLECLEDYKEAQDNSPFLRDFEDDDYYANS